jgi:hypothetical protein
MKHTEREKSLKELEAKIERLEAEMKTADLEQIDAKEEIDRSASFFTPFFVAILLTIAIYLIDRFVVS